MDAILELDARSNAFPPRGLPPESGMRIYECDAPMRAAFAQLESAPGKGAVTANALATLCRNAGTYWSHTKQARRYHVAQVAPGRFRAFAEALPEPMARQARAVDRVLDTLVSGIAPPLRPRATHDIYWFDRKALLDGAQWPAWVWMHDDRQTHLLPLGMHQFHHDAVRAMREQWPGLSLYVLDRDAASGEFHPRKVDGATLTARLAATPPMYTTQSLTAESEFHARIGIHGRNGTHMADVILERGSDGRSVCANLVVHDDPFLSAPTTPYVLQKLTVDSVNLWAGIDTPIRDVTMKESFQARMRRQLRSATTNNDTPTF